MSLIGTHNNKNSTHMEAYEIKINEKVEALKRNLLDRANRDIEFGKKDAMAGVYDKWYRWNRDDDGAAYDYGWKKAFDGTKNVQIIECQHN